MEGIQEEKCWQTIKNSNVAAQILKAAAYAELREPNRSKMLPNKDLPQKPLKMATQSGQIPRVNTLYFSLILGA